MKRLLLIPHVVLALIMTVFMALGNAAIENCDYSVPRSGTVHGRDLARFIHYYATGAAGANVDGSENVDQDDVAHFAGFFGQSYVATRPNILLIIADDVGIDVTTDMYPGLIDALATTYGDGVRGQPASTPVLDQFAQQGMRFSSAWAQPVCSPTRAALITGLFGVKTGVLTPGNPLKSSHITFVKLLNDSGYNTGLFGKWHLGTGGTGPFAGVLPKQVGFDLFRGHTGGGIPDFWNYPIHVQDNSTTDPTTYSTILSASQVDQSLPGISPTKFAPVVKVAEVIDWIEDRVTEDQPWLAWLAFNQSHTPMHVPNGDTIGCHPDDPDLDSPICQEIKDCGGVPGTNNAGDCDLIDDTVLMRAMTTAMDTVIGKLLDAVEALDPNTYVIFVGDNGTDVSTLTNNCIDNMYLTLTGRGKGSVYESGARVPMAIRGPNIEPGSESREFVHVTDLFATCLKLAGLTPPARVPDLNGIEVDSDSVSLTPILSGDASIVRDPELGYILTETTYPNPDQVGVRNATYKLVCKGNTSNCSFYNLVADPLEEDPLPKPTSCPSGTPGDPAWHYCQLIDVVNMYSIF